MMKQNVKKHRLETFLAVGVRSGVEKGTQLPYKVMCSIFWDVAVKAKEDKRHEAYNKTSAEFQCLVLIISLQLF